MQTWHSMQQSKDKPRVVQTNAPGHQQGPTLLTTPTHPATLIRRAAADPRTLSPADVLQLHRTIGNRAVGRLLRSGRAVNSLSVGRRQDEREKPNATGLPARLRADIEALSSLSLDDVHVHYNSSKPAEVQALAYTQGTDVHVGPGQENHLPHEAWHVVQQKQGRVQPTVQVSGVPVNDDTALEREADVVGRQAKQLRLPDRTTFGPGTHAALGGQRGRARPDAADGSGVVIKPATNTRGADAVHVPAVVQRQVFKNAEGKFYSDVDPETTFDTYQEAEAYEVNMPAPDPTKSEDTERAPTLFTYVMTPSHYQIPGISLPQGPHTVGHAALSTALFAAQISPGALSSEQVPPPDVWRDQVIRECGANVFDPQTVIPEKVRKHYRKKWSDDPPTSEEIVARFLRAYKVYNGLWQELRRIVAGQSTEEPRDVIDELIQLGAYSVYGYGAPGKIGGAQLKGKGENRDLTDPKNVDRLAKFRNRADYEEMIESRMLLLDFDYNPILDESMDEDISEFPVHEPAVEPEATLMTVAGQSLGESSGPPSSSTRSKPRRLSMIVHHEKILVDNHPMLYLPEEVPSDGDCFFNSMIKLGYGGDVKTLRQIAQQNGGQENITTEKTWAGEQDIAAIAMHFKIRIREIVVGFDGTITQDTTAGDAGPVVPIAHIYGGHFTPLRGLQLGASLAPVPKASTPAMTSTGEKPSEEPGAGTRKRNPSRESGKQLPKKKKK